MCRQDFSVAHKILCYINHICFRGILKKKERKSLFKKPHFLKRRTFLAFTSEMVSWSGFAAFREILRRRWTGARFAFSVRNHGIAVKSFGAFLAKFPIGIFSAALFFFLHENFVTKIMSRRFCLGSKEQEETHQTASVFDVAFVRTSIARAFLCFPHYSIDDDASVDVRRPRVVPIEADARILAGRRVVLSGAFTDFHADCFRRWMSRYFDSGIQGNV